MIYNETTSSYSPIWRSLSLAPSSDTSPDSQPDSHHHVSNLHAGVQYVLLNFLLDLVFLFKRHKFRYCFPIYSREKYELQCLEYWNIILSPLVQITYRIHPLNSPIYVRLTLFLLCLLWKIIISGANRNLKWKSIKEFVLKATPLLFLHLKSFCPLIDAAFSSY